MKWGWGRDGLTRRSRETLPRQAGRQLEKPKLGCSWVEDIDFLPFCLYGCQVLLPHSHLLHCKDTTDSARALHRKPTWPLSSSCAFSPYTSFSSAAPFLPEPLHSVLCTSKFFFAVLCDFVGPLRGTWLCSASAPCCPVGCQDPVQIHPGKTEEQHRATHHMSAGQQEEQIVVLTWHGWAQMSLPATIRQSPAMVWWTNHTLSRQFGIVQWRIFVDGQIYFREENACGEPNFSQVL